MTDAPERILVIEDSKFGWPNGFTAKAPAEPWDDRNPVEYTRTDLSLAAQGALLEKAARVLDRHYGVPCEPVHPDKWTEESLSAYESGQMDAAASWKATILSLDPDALTALREHEDRIRREERYACAKIAEAEMKKHAAETYSGGTVSVHRSGQSAARCYAAGHILTLIKERDGG